MCINGHIVFNCPVITLREKDHVSAGTNEERLSFCSGFGSDAAGCAGSCAICPVIGQQSGGVEKPGGLFNTNDDPRVGGLLKNQGGFSTLLFP